MAFWNDIQQVAADELEQERFLSTGSRCRGRMGGPQACATVLLRLAQGFNCIAVASLPQGLIFFFLLLSF
jgi:hypothetical protein